MMASNLLPLIGVAILAIGLGFAGTQYLADGEQHLQRTMNWILWYEMRLGVWER